MTTIIFLLGIIFFLSCLFVIFPYTQLIIQTKYLKKIKRRLDVIEKWVTVQIKREFEKNAK